MKFIMLIGCSGSGKSTLAEELRAHDEGLVVISSDAVIEDLAASDGIDYQTAYLTYRDHAMDICEQTAAEAFSRGLNVVWDQTNLTRQLRSGRLEMVPDNYEKIAVCYQGGVAEIRRRLELRQSEGGRYIPLSVLHKQISDYAPPDYDEGFDKIVIQNVTRTQISQVQPDIEPAPEPEFAM